MIFLLGTSAEGQLFFDKTANVTTKPLFEDIEYKFIIRNIGSTNLTDLKLNDDRLGNLTSLLPTTTLLPGQWANFTYV